MALLGGDRSDGSRRHIISLASLTLLLIVLHNSGDYRESEALRTLIFLSRNIPKIKAVYSEAL